ncbi:MAG: aminomethyl-transferring glycine dehydrogenase [Sulfobacillus benefaciens]|uniref:Probable glycine dehydrogenase (decarboxylating) subunit 1 n=1 Tax=Sulfobacillus benefaciens TaxID=453960 RepID=A0A2T2XGM6_9FIRM|nr:MAG: aminomethyl-transferring glycine dehydrogenase [Sulfobacillus benefaciens]
MRYIPHTPNDRDLMLKRLQISSIDDLFSDIPESARLNRPLNLPSALSELELRRHLMDLSRKNRSAEDLVMFLGGGFYDRFIPSTVSAIASRGEFATAYTPYQAELSQGTLAAIYEFQTMIAGLTGTAAAQASMYDGASSVGEAALLALAHTKRGRIVVHQALHPDSLAVVRTYVGARGGTVEVVRSVAELEAVLASGDPAAAVIWQYPDMLGRILGLESVIEIAHRHQSLAIVSSDPIALALLTPPGELGADVVVGEGQPLGNPLNYGGPTFGYFAVQASLVRKMPGRLVGATVDAKGSRGFVLTLQAREQHIRRDKATSNICSNHSLNALMATVYMASLGPQGIREVALLSTAKAHYLAQQLTNCGLNLAFPDEPYLYEFAVKVPGSVLELNQFLLERGYLGGFDLGRWDPEWAGFWQLATTEKRTKEECDGFCEEVSRWMSR